MKRHESHGLNKFGYYSCCVAEKAHFITLYITINVCLLACNGFAQNADIQRTNRNSRVSDTIQFQRNECLDAAKKVLGERAEVLKCGTLNDPNVLETVAALRKKTSHGDAADIFVSQLVILRHEASGWNKALSASKQLKNTVGSIGTSYVDDAFQFWGYSVKFYNSRSDGEKEFVISLAYMSSERDTEEVPIDISWDKSVGRYREFNLYNEPVGFKAELKNPPVGGPGLK